MFDQTWKWAGAYRSPEKNIGIAHYQVREALAALLGDARYWLEHQTFPPDEVAVRFHHRLVWIHPFANGNGRHARVMADILIERQGGPASLGVVRASSAGEFRNRYIQALRAADAGDIRPILKFARS